MSMTGNTAAPLASIVPAAGQIPITEDWPECSLNFWPEAAGAFLASLYGDPEPEPGPPYVHTIVPPEPIGELEDGTLIYPEPGPAYTMTERP